MVRALSLDIRKRMAKAADAGASLNSVGKRFDVAASTVTKLMTHAKVTLILMTDFDHHPTQLKLESYEPYLCDPLRMTASASAQTQSSWAPSAAAYRTPKRVYSYSNDLSSRTIGPSG